MKAGEKGKHIREVMNGLVRWLRLSLHGVKNRLTGKWLPRAQSDRLSKPARPPLLRETAVKPLRTAWAALEYEYDQMQDEHEAREESKGHGIQPPDQGAAERSDMERDLIERIKRDTAAANRNNVTRTEAYREMYFRRPELHWALLAHLVSRNGGYNMTDLRGELLPRLLEEQQASSTFQMLERINSLIFADAYPQLLLYEAGRKTGRELTHLLSSFQISRFMVPVWSHFWQRQDSAVLTTALIVNEQHYIEGRIVQDSYYRDRVLETLAFMMQAPLQTNAVFMPYGAPQAGEMRLAGLILEHFDDLVERIEFGKRLYAVLFGVDAVREGVLAFVRCVQHSGSRSDYAPHLFTVAKPVHSSKRYKQKLDGCRIMRGRTPIYSPTLVDAWPDQPVEASRSNQDWFTTSAAVERYFQRLPLPEEFEVTEAYCRSLNELELAVQAAERLGLSEKP
ncbi:DUF2515 family protein [Paenibacillus mendelii]|uniref:DUF2515 family protein n=1 Tax=Paenibacillus mendelii TaxID=206163 RepID=A0ABV6J631_9BACL|nr:DUF2515 family protein [Paenibacillus mendelii]MCQ6560335.1 DUF2515 domain-containing protein [Paenibacillus mendelii]